MKVLRLESSRFMYLCSMSHSICSLIIFLGGMNMFFRISTSSVCRAALVIRFRIFIIFTTASWSEGGSGKEGGELGEGEMKEGEGVKTHGLGSW